MGIAVRNRSLESIYVFVTTWNNKGRDEWFEIKPGESETWDRTASWEFVAIKNKEDTKRTGVYLECNKSREVTFDYFPPNNTSPFGLNVYPRE